MVPPPAAVQVKDVSLTPDPTKKIADEPTLFRINRRGSAHKIDAARYQHTKAKVQDVWTNAKTMIEAKYNGAYDMRLDFANRAITFKTPDGKERRITQTMLGVVGNEPEQQAEQTLRNKILQELKDINDLLADELKEPDNSDPNRPIRFVAQHSRWDYHRDINSYDSFINNQMGHQFLAKFLPSTSEKADLIESRLKATDRFIQELQNKIEGRIKTAKKDLKDLKNDKNQDKSKIDKINKSKQLIEDLKKLQQELKDLQGPQRIAIYAAIATRIAHDTENQTESEFDDNQLPEMEADMRKKLTDVLQETLPVEDSRSLPVRTVATRFGIGIPKPDPKQTDFTIVDSAHAAADLLSQGHSLEHLIVYNMVHLNGEPDTDLKSVHEKAAKDSLEALSSSLRKELEPLVVSARESVQKNDIEGEKRVTAEEQRNQVEQEFHQKLWEAANKREDGPIANWIDGCSTRRDLDIFARKLVNDMQDGFKEHEQRAKRASNLQELENRQLIAQDVRTNCDTFLRQYRNASNIDEQKAALRQLQTLWINSFAPPPLPITDEEKRKLEELSAQAEARFGSAPERKDQYDTDWCEKARDNIQKLADEIAVIQPPAAPATPPPP